MKHSTSSVGRLMAPNGDDRLRPPALLSVDVGENEDVEWIWTHPIDGQSFVSGYRVVPRLPRLWQSSKDRRNG